MKAAVIVFPAAIATGTSGGLSESLNNAVDMVWHEDEALLRTDLVILPGGFSYGDYLRSGAMAARSPIIKAVREHADRGGLVLGICNGFQILTETKMLPGALLPNTSLTFICRRCHIRVERTDNKFTAGLKEGEILQFPIAHHEGLFFLPDDELKYGRCRTGIFRYADPDTGRAGAEYAPNGALNGIAGSAVKRAISLG